LETENNFHYVKRRNEILYSLLTTYIQCTKKNLKVKYLFCWWRWSCLKHRTLGFLILILNYKQKIIILLQKEWEILYMVCLRQV